MTVLSLKNVNTHLSPVYSSVKYRANFSMLGIVAMVSVARHFYGQELLILSPTSFKFICLSLRLVANQS